MVLKKGMEFDAVQAFKKLQADNKNIKGVWFELEYKRVYPNNSLASHVIGYTNAGNVGTYGIEQFYNDYLNGTDGRTYGYYDNELNLVETVVKAKNGGTRVRSHGTQRQKSRHFVSPNEYIRDYEVERSASASDRSSKKRRPSACRRNASGTEQRLFIDYSNRL